MARKDPTPVVVLLDSDAIEQRPTPPELGRFLRTAGCVAGEIVPDESFCVVVLDPFGG